MKKRDRSEYVNANKIGPANLLLHTLFGQVDVSLNNKLVSLSSATYSYQTYLEMLLNYRKATEESQLTAIIWYKNIDRQDGRHRLDS